MALNSINTVDTAPVAALAAYYNIPLISAGSISTNFNQKRIYKTLIRFSPALVRNCHQLKTDNLNLIKSDNLKTVPFKVANLPLSPILPVNSSKFLLASTNCWNLCIYKFKNLDGAEEKKLKRVKKKAKNEEK